MTELVRRLDRTRFRVHVACFHREGAWLPRVAEAAASVVEFPIHGFARPATAAQLLAFARWCRREHIAVVQTCDLYANILGLPGAALAGVPVRIGSRRELNPDKTAGQIRLQRQAYRCATKVAANSSAARDLLRREGLAPESIAVIPNGIDAAAYPERSANRTARPVRSVITVANLRAEKNHETLIAAAALLADEFPDVQFLIAGDGPRRHALEALVKSRRLEHRVIFLGHCDNVARLLADADVFVLPSRSEAFPNAAMEAMASGLPVVAGAVGGLLDLVEPGRTGILVDPEDAHAFATALRHLFTDPADAARMGRAARAEVLQRYSFDRMVQAFEELYLAGLPAAAPAAQRQAAAGVSR